MKIFWSWQSDTPKKTGRFLVRDAIRAAIKKLKQSEDIEEPTTSERLDSLHLDQDSQGLPGSPDLARAIFKKIDAASVIIADVTIVCRGKKQKDIVTGKTVKGRAFVNPNVGIEVGYALKAVGDSRLLLAVNTHYGPTEDLPFDLRHKRISLVYSLAENADQAKIKEVEKALTSTLVQALRSYLASPQELGQEVEIIKQPTKQAPAFFFDEGETLAQIGEPGVDEIDFSMQTDKALYLRLIPMGKRLRPLTPRQLAEGAEELGTFWEDSGRGFSESNEYGHIIFQPDRPHGPQILALTQVFPTGEIWGINRHFMRYNDDHKRMIIPSLLFEKSYFDTLERYLKYMQKLGIEPPFALEAGLAGCKNHSLARDYGMPIGPIRQNSIKFDCKLKTVNADVVQDCLLKFFQHVYNYTPHARPDRDWGFPPDRPSYRSPVV